MHDERRHMLPVPFCFSRPSEMIQNGVAFLTLFLYLLCTGNPPYGIEDLEGASQ